MIVERVSDITGARHLREINITPAEIEDWKTSGAHIQNYFPGLSDDDREFILTGITPEEWGVYMTEDD